MATVSELEVVLRGDDGDLNRSMDRADNRISDFQRNTNRKLQDLSREIVAFGVGMGLALAGGAIYASIEWETAFANVEKTVEGTDEELGELEDTLRGLATTGVTGALGDAHDAMAGIAAAAGSLGIATEDIDEFTETVAIMSVATGMGAEELATWAARFANVTGMDMGNLPLLSDTLVTLENNMAATADEITQFSSRMANLATFGFEPDEILAYSAAMASLGLTSELGSTNFVKSVSDMTTAVATGSDELAVWAETAGMTIDQFSALASTDGEGAFLAFLEGLRDLPVEEQLQRLNQLGITSQEQQRTIMTLAAGYDTVTESLGYANVAWEGNNAALTEANAQADTTQGSINRMNNALRDIGITLGDRFSPAIADLSEGLANLLNGNHAEGLAQIGEGFKGLASGIGSLVTGDENFDFQSTIDAWSWAWLALNQISEDILDSIRLFFGNLTREFYQGIMDVMSVASPEAWEMAGLGDIYNTLSQISDNVTMDVAAIQFGDAIGEAINQQLAATGDIQLDQPISVMVGDEMITLSTGAAILNPDILAEIDPIAMQTLKTEIQSQLQAAVASGDEAAIEMLLPVAVELEIPEALAIDMRNQALALAGGTDLSANDLELADFRFQPNLIMELPDYAQDELRTQLYSEIDAAIASGDPENIQSLVQIGIALGVNVEAVAMNDALGAQILDPSVLVTDTLGLSEAPVTVDISAILQANEIDMDSVQSSVNAGIEGVREQVRELSILVDLVIVPNSVDSSRIISWGQGSISLPGNGAGGGGGNTTVINSYGNSPYELNAAIDANNQASGPK